MPFLNTWVIAVFGIYFAALIGIAVMRAQRMRAMQDYVLGGRQLNALTSALSAGSSAVSSGSMLVVPALAFADGGATVWLAGSIFLGAVLSWTLLARRLRRYTMAAGDSLTISEFLEKRFDDRTGVLRSLVAVVTLFFVVIYISSGLVGGSKLLEVTFGLAPNVGIAVTLLAVASYTLVGGFLAVSRTDVFQSLIMLGSFTIIPVMLLQATDNPISGLVSGGNEYLNPLNDSKGGALSWVYVASLPGWAFGAWGSLRVLQRYMAIRDENTIPTSRNIAVAWLFLITAFGVAIGWGGPAGAGTGWNATVGARRPREGLLCGHGGVLPPSLCGCAAVRGDRCRDEHGGLPAVVGLGRRDGRPAGPAAVHLCPAGAGPHLDGAISARGDRIGGNGHCTGQARLNPGAGGVRLWWDGLGLWPVPHSVAVLEALQLLGSDGGRACRDCGVVSLGLRDRGTRRHVGPHGRDARIRGRAISRRRGDASDTRSSAPRDGIVR